MVGGDSCPVGRHDRLRVELPSGAVLAGPGWVEVTRRDGGQYVKVYVHD